LEKAAPKTSAFGAMALTKAAALKVKVLLPLFFQEKKGLAGF